MNEEGGRTSLPPLSHLAIKSLKCVTEFLWFVLLLLSISKAEEGSSQR